MEKREKIIEIAKTYGFCDGKFVPYQNGDYVDEKKPLSFAPKSILLLFYRYGETEAPKEGYISLSNYYPASHKVYHNAKKLTKTLQEAGIVAVHAPNMFLKQIAARAGGHMGKNSLYYHETYGSFVVLQAILLEEGYGAEEMKSTLLPGCNNCQICTAACPTGAIGKEIGALCLRARMEKRPMDMEAREKMFQLLGCEICQSVCPYNEKCVMPAHQYLVQDILEKHAIPAIQEIAGKNMARTTVLLSQAIAYAVKQNRKECIPAIFALKEVPLLKEMVSWALANL
ncbi:MAG: 4Fe-4S double cluster binding domain-containing protein [Christensenellaceae bacterium]|jgi:epoxyqueuosine reductase QueG